MSEDEVLPKSDIQTLSRYNTKGSVEQKRVSMCPLCHLLGEAPGNLTKHQTGWTLLSMDSILAISQITKIYRRLSYYQVWDELGVQDGLLFRGDLEVIPTSLKGDIMK